MHIPDGYLGPSTYGALWVAMVGVWSYASGKVKKEMKTSQVPFLAVASAFTFVAMIFAIPLPGGTTAHITGATLIAVLLGPWASVMAVSVSLMIQALVFGDGGVTAIAANSFNIAVIGPLVGYHTYRLIIKTGRWIGVHKDAAPKDKELSHLTLRAVGTAIGAYIGMNAAALFTALELGLQPLIYGSGLSPVSGYFPYSLRITIPAIMIPHLTLVGTLEGVVAWLVLLFLQKTKSGIIRGVKVAVFISTISLIFLLSSAAFAHDFRIEQKGQAFILFFGHGEHREEFETSKVHLVKAFDLQGKELIVQKEKKGRALELRIEGQPSVMRVEVDNGYWSKTIYGWKELPKRKASRVVEAVRSLYYSKIISSWNDAIRTASTGARLDIIPLGNPFEMKAGDFLSLKILYDDQPLSGVKVNVNDHKKLGKTDQEGVIKVQLIKGNQAISVEHRERLQDDPDADVLTLTATLAFEVKK